MIDRTFIVLKYGQPGSQEFMDRLPGEVKLRAFIQRYYYGRPESHGDLIMQELIQYHQND